MLIDQGRGHFKLRSFGGQGHWYFCCYVLYPVLLENVTYSSVFKNFVQHGQDMRLRLKAANFEIEHIRLKCERNLFFLIRPFNNSFFSV